MNDPTCAEHTRGVVVARVLQVRAHPDAERIWLAIVDLGDGSKHQVVFGGDRPDIEGKLVPAAPPGAQLPGRKKMRRRNYRGESSYGMLCSSDELGWTFNLVNEVAILDPDMNLEPGQSLDCLDAPRFLVLPVGVRG